VHGHQQLSLFNAHSDERCFLPIQVYDANTGHCVVTNLRPGKTPNAKEVRPSPGYPTRLCLVGPLASLALLRRLVRRIRLHWPNTLITRRGDNRYGRREAMAWCEQNGLQYVLGLSKNATLDALVLAKANEVQIKRAIDQLDVVRDYTKTRYAALSWPHSRRIVAQFEANP
jgi:hypothetical protein